LRQDNFLTLTQKITHFGALKKRGGRKRMKHSKAMVAHLILTLLLGIHCHAALSAEKSKIGIMRFEVAKNLDPALGGFLYDILLQRMVASSKHTVVDWEEIDRVLKYIAASQPNVSEDDAKKQAVDQLGIEKMYVGAIRKVGTKHHVSVKALNLDLTVSAVVRGSATNVNELESVMNALADELLMSPEELAKAKDRLKSGETALGETGRLYVRTTPPDSRIRVLNIKPMYRDGIELRPGDYHIEVSKRGFTTERRWASLSPGEDKKLQIDLAPKPSRPTPLSKGPAQKSSTLWTEPITGMSFVWIPGGCFQMGSPTEEVGRNANECPHHSVCVDGFWMGKEEVNNEQYRTFRSQHSSGSYKDYTLDSRDQPVVSVSWEDARAFAGWLSTKHNGQYRFRLPTEAEWEYACRSGTQTSRYWGNDPKKACQYESVLDITSSTTWPNRACHRCEDGYKVTAPVGSFQPNAFGLHDMLGNAMEWCEDSYSNEAYATHQRNNPIYRSEGPYRVMRGGSWSCGPDGVRCARRSSDKAKSRFPDVSFRLVRMP
jgi:formylglycine-generating enzyme required for sulfatase activity